MTVPQQLRKETLLFSQLILPAQIQRLLQHQYK